MINKGYQLKGLDYTKNTMVIAQYAIILRLEGWQTRISSRCAVLGVLLLSKKKDATDFRP